MGLKIVSKLFPPLEISVSSPYNISFTLCFASHRYSLHFVTLVITLSNKVAKCTQSSALRLYIVNMYFVLRTPPLPPFLVPCYGRAALHKITRTRIFSSCLLLIKFLRSNNTGFRSLLHRSPLELDVKSQTGALLVSLIFILVSPDGVYLH